MHDALVDTGSAFSMLSESLYSQLPTCPPIQFFKKPAPDIVGVGGARAEVKGYIDVPHQIAGVEVAHPLLVVSGLAFQILIGMDVLRTHSAAMLLDESVPFQLNTRICDICLERRTDLDRNF